MASARQLQRRIRELEQQLAQQERRNQEIRRQIREQTASQIDRIQRDAQQTFQRKLDETAESYARRVRQFQEETLRASKAQLNALRREAEELSRQTRAAMAEMERCNQELRQELQKLRDDARRQDTVFRQTAEEAQSHARQAREEANQTPHSFFCPNEFDIIDGHIGDVTDLIQRGMYQAAVSDAQCIELEFRLLRTKVDQAFSEWMQAFEDYRCIVTTLNQRLQQFEQQSLPTSEGEFRMKPRELDFWSCGAYGDLAKSIRDAYDTFAAMDESQIRQYLQERSGTNRRAIFELVTQGHKWEDQLVAVINCICSERIMSDQRLTVAKAFAKRLEEGNYRTDLKRFRAPRPERVDQSWYIAPKSQDPAGSYDVQMSLSATNRVKLRIIPRREHGLAVENRYLLTISFSGANDPTTEKQVAEAHLQRLEELSRKNSLNIRVQYIPTREKPERAISQQETLFNTNPNPGEQIRYLERKYR